eukprot:7306555-Lingulodinium_polyedra.AAC.1
MTSLSCFDWHWSTQEPRAQQARSLLRNCPAKPGITIGPIKLRWCPVVAERHKIMTSCWWHGLFPCTIQ